MKGYIQRSIAARRLLVKPQRISQLCRSGKLGYVTDVEDRVWVNESDVEAYAHAHDVELDPRELSKRKREQRIAAEERRRHQAKREEEAAADRKLRRDVRDYLKRIAEALEREGR